MEFGKWKRRRLSQLDASINSAVKEQRRKEKVTGKSFQFAEGAHTWLIPPKWLVQATTEILHK